MDKMKPLSSCNVNDELYSVYDYDAYSIQELLCQYYDRINKNANLTNQLIEVIEHSGGIQGPKGDKGETGAQGPTGQQGPMGPMGPQGHPGIQGIRGERGPTGDPGPQGVPGPRGQMGETGPGINFKGEKDTDEQIQQIVGAGNGDCYYSKKSRHIWVYTTEQTKWIDVGEIRGVEGPQGPPGPQGNQGPAGQTGSTGAKGDPGDKGDEGPAGPQGPIGPTGAPGPAGVAGPQGERGQGVPPYSPTENGKILGVENGSTKWIDKPAGGGGEAPRTGFLLGGQFFYRIKGADLSRATPRTHFTEMYKLSNPNRMVYTIPFSVKPGDKIKAYCDNDDLKFAFHCYTADGTNVKDSNWSTTWSARTYTVPSDKDYRIALLYIGTDRPSISTTHIQALLDSGYVRFMN